MKNLMWEPMDTGEIFPEENRATLKSRVFPSTMWGLDKRSFNPSFSPYQLVDAEKGNYLL